MLSIWMIPPLKRSNIILHLTNLYIFKKLDVPALPVSSKFPILEVWFWFEIHKWWDQDYETFSSFI